MFVLDDFRSTLDRVVSVLRSHDIRFHLTGGITSVIYGEPRMTQDVDIVLDRARVLEVLDPLLADFVAAGFDLSEETARRAVTEQGMFQLLDPEAVIKIDLYVRAMIPGELDRSVRVELFPGVEIPVASRSDVALSKLIWIREGSDRSRRDLRRILAGATEGELATVRATAARMGLGTLLREVLEEPPGIDD